MVIRTSASSPSFSGSSTVTSVSREVQRLGDRRDSQVAHRGTARAEQHRGDVGDDLVDQPGLQERRRQRRAALEEHVLPVAGVEVRRAPPRDRGCAGGPSRRRRRRSGGRDRGRARPITARSGWRGSGGAVGVADGQLGVVDGDGAGADEDRVAPGSEPVHVGRAAGRRSTGWSRRRRRCGRRACVANFQVTNGRPCSTANVQTRFSGAASSREAGPSRPRRPAARSVSAPTGRDRVRVGLGEDDPRTPAATRASRARPGAPGVVARLEGHHGGRPRRRAAGPGERVDLGVRCSRRHGGSPPRRRGRRGRAGRSRPAGSGPRGTPSRRRQRERAAHRATARSR